VSWQRGLLIAWLAVSLVSCAAGGGGGPAARSGAAAPPAGGAQAPSAGGAATNAAQPAPSRRVALKYGLNTPTISVANVWAAKEQGLFDKYGLDVELVTLPADQIVAALIGGELAMSHLAGTPLVAGVLGGADLEFVGSAADKLRFWLYARPEITSVRELRGKEIAITSRAGVVRRAAELTLERNGMNPDGDATYVATGNLNNSLAALLSGNVAAALLAPPVSFRAQDEGMRLLVNIEDYDMQVILSGIAVTRAWRGRNEDVALRMLQALAEGTAFAVQNKERMVEIAAQYLQSNDMELMERSYDAQAPAWKRGTLRVQPEAIRFDLDAAAVDNPAARDARPEQFYDNRLVEVLEQQGVFQRLWQ
jgi:ABC-type nitrate/sulfonate/bicarbonate transport system substrate-binding protein